MKSVWLLKHFLALTNAAVDWNIDFSTVNLLATRRSRLS